MAGDIQVLENDLDGYGKRLNTMEISSGKNGVKVDRNEREIGGLWKSVEAIKEDIKGMTGKIAWIAGGISFVSIIVVSVVQLVVVLSTLGR